MNSLSIESTNGLKFTNNDALQNRIDAHLHSYINDPISLLFRNSKTTRKKYPISRIGTYIRTTFIDNFFSDLLAENHSQNIRIVSLGAGFDTRYFRLKSKLMNLNRYIEIDFPEILEEKAALLAKNNVEHDIEFVPLDLSSSNACSALEDLLNRSLNESQLTIVLAECIFPYLEKDSGAFIMQFFAKQPNCHLVAFEFCNLNDSFGVEMLKSLSNAQIYIPNKETYSSVDSLISEYTRNGWCNILHCTMLLDWSVRRTPSEKQKILKLELIDEFEEMNILFNHHCFITACSNSTLPA